jgi:hypothetical protein
MSTYIPQQHVPFVPRSVSVPLVAAALLATKLASTAPELLNVSKLAFEEDRINDGRSYFFENTLSNAVLIK